MPVEPKIDWGRVKALFDNTGVYNSAEIRESLDTIAGIILGFLYDPGSIGDPEVPENLTLSGGDNVATLVWSPAANAVQYDIQRADASSPDTITDVATTSATGYTDAGLDAGTYLYRIRSRSLAQVVSDWTEWEQVTVESDTSGTPTTPTNFACGTPTETTIPLSWDALAVGTVAIRIESKRTGLPWTTITVTTGTSFTHTGLIPGTAYSYRAYGVAADGSESAATADDSETVAAADTTAPAVPGSTSGTTGVGYVKFAWAAVEDPQSPPVTYDFRHSETSGSGYTTITGLTGTDTIVSADTGTTVYAQVRAVDAVGNASAWSAEFSGATDDAAPTAVPLPPPTGVSATNAGSESMLIEWTEIDRSSGNNAQAQSYVIYLSTTNLPGSFTQNSVIPVGSSSAEIDSLTNGITYYLQMVTRDTTGLDGPASPTVQFVPLAIDNTNQGSPINPTDPNGNVTGITTEPDEGSSVHVYLESSAEENRTRFVDGMRGTRTGQTANLVGDSVLTPTSHGAYADGAFGAGDFSQWCLNVSRGNQQSAGNSAAWSSINDILVLDNVDATYAWPDARQRGLKWFRRAYRVPGIYTYQTDIGPDSFTQDVNGSGFVVDELPHYSYYREHGHYDSLYGPAVVNETTIARMGGQALQFAHRQYAYGQYSGDNPAWAADQLVLIDNVHVMDVGVESTRGAFAFTFFDIGNPTYPSTIIVRNSTIIERYPFYKKNAGSSSGLPKTRTLTDPAGISDTQNYHRANGAVVVTQFDFVERPGSLQPGNPHTSYGPAPGVDYPTADHPVETLVFQNCYIDMTRPEKPVMSLEGINNVIFENCAFRVSGDAGGNPGGQVIFNENRYDRGTIYKGTRPCGTITFRNCISVNINWRVRLAGGGLQTLNANCPGEELVYNGSTGALTSASAFDPTSDNFDTAGAINTIDPFAGYDLQSTTVVWPMSGVTATAS